MDSSEINKLLKEFSDTKAGENRSAEIIGPQDPNSLSEKIKNF